MQIISSDLVSEASRLPAAALVVAAAVGPLFWVLGWRVHRALFVAASTLIGGVYGLAHGSSFGLNPALAAGLLCLSAGGLALAILRIGVFIVFGAVVDLVAVKVMEKQDGATALPWLRMTAFFAGGLISLVYYRFLVIVLTSFAGAFLLVLGGLAFAAHYGELDPATLVDKRAQIVSLVFVVLGAVGTWGQHMVERRRSAKPPAPPVNRDPANELVRQLLKTKKAA